MRRVVVFLLVIFCVGALAESTGELRWSLELNGKSSLIVDRFIGGGLPNTPVTYNESFTFEAWIYPQNNSVFHRGVILQSGIIWAVPLTSYVLQYDYQQQIVVAQVWTRMDDTWNVDEVASQDIVPLDSWVHVTFTPATWEVTIDTRVPSCAITTALIPPYPKPPRLFGIGDQFVGYIDDVRVWNRTLSPMEMAQYLTRGVCVSDADDVEDLVLFLSFDEGPASNITLDVSQSLACARIKPSSDSGSGESSGGASGGPIEIPSSGDIPGHAPANSGSSDEDTDDNDNDDNDDDSSSNSDSNDEAVNSDAEENETEKRTEPKRRRHHFGAVRNGPRRFGKREWPFDSADKHPIPYVMVDAKLNFTACNGKWRAHHNDSEHGNSHSPISPSSGGEGGGGSYSPGSGNITANATANIPIPVNYPVNESSSSGRPVNIPTIIPVQPPTSTPIPPKPEPTVEPKDKGFDSDQEHQQSEHKRGGFKRRNHHKYSRNSGNDDDATSKHYTRGSGYHKRLWTSNWDPYVTHSIKYGPQSPAVHTCWKSLIDEIVTQCPYPIQPIPDPTSGSGDTNGNDPNGSADHQTPSERPTFHPGTGKPNEPGSGSGDADAGPADTPSATQTTTNVIHHQDASDDGTDFFDMLNDTTFNMFLMFALFVIMFGFFTCVRKIMSTQKCNKNRGRERVPDTDEDDIESLPGAFYSVRSGSPIPPPSSPLNRSNFDSDDETPQPSSQQHSPQLSHHSQQQQPPQPQQPQQPTTTTTTTITATATRQARNPSRNNLYMYYTPQMQLPPQ